MRVIDIEINHHPLTVSCRAFCGCTKLTLWKHVASVKKFDSRFTSAVTLVVVRTTKQIVGPPDPLSWWSCGPLLIKVCVKAWLVSIVFTKTVPGNFSVHKI